MKMCLVVWEDASEVDSGTWIDRGTAPEAEPIIFHQIGFIYRFTPTELVLTSCVGVHQMGVRTRIPAGMIRSITNLVPSGQMRVPKRKRKP